MDHTGPLVEPDDDANRALVAQVHPPGWVNPEPGGRYNLVVLGAGSAGLVTAAIAAGLGARVALVEQRLMGGDCLNFGCVPSKALIRSARAWADVSRAGEHGASFPGGVDRDFGAVMARVRALRARLSPNDSAERFRSLGVDVYLGAGRFTGADRLEVAGKALRFARAAVCTGARAMVPATPGLREAGFLTNETVFSLTDRPARLAVVGGGPIGCELAQAFARLGSQVALFERSGRILPRDDPDAANVLHHWMKAEGVSFFLNADLKHVERRGEEKVLTFTTPGFTGELACDAILLGAGRAPVVAELGLEAAGVAHCAARGVLVDDHLRTTNPRIFAAGDVCSPFRFTHAADAQARALVQNALFPHPLGLGRARASALVIPWCTFTDPEVAQVGLTEAEARSMGVSTETYTVLMDQVDRAVIDGETAGFARVLVREGTDEVVGATIVAAHAGEVISVFTTLMTARRGLSALGATIHAYPTQGEVVRKLADAWRRARFTPSRKRLVTRWFRWARR